MIRISKFDGTQDNRILPLGQVLQIEKECFRAPWGCVALTGTMEMQNTSLYLVEENGKPVSYCISSRVFDEAELLRIAVLAEYRRRGFADLMMKMLLAEWKARDIRKIFLEVRRSNIPAASLYEKYGFRTVSMRKNYYENGEDALVYICEPNNKE